MDIESLEVQVLFTTQTGHSKVADGIQILRVAEGGHMAVVGVYGFLCQEGGGNILDVLALVAVSRPAWVQRFDSQAAGLYGYSQVCNLLSGVVVVKFAGYIPSGCTKQPTDGIADGRTPSMTDMQRAGRVGADEFHLNFSGCSGCRAP